MATSEVLKEYFIDIKYRTDAADGKQAQIALDMLDGLASDAQKSIDGLTRKLSGLSSVLRELGGGNTQVLHDLKSVRDESNRNDQQDSASHQSRRGRRRQELQDIRDTARTQKEIEDEATRSTQARSRDAEQERKRILQQERADAAQKRREEAEINRQRRKDEQEHNRLLDETARRTGEVRNNFIAMGAAAVVAAREAWRSLRETGKEYAALTVDANTYKTSVRDLIVLGKTIELSGLEKLTGQFESFTNAMINVTGQKEFVSGWIQQITGMSATAYNALPRMEQFRKTLQALREDEQRQLRSGATPEAARRHALDLGELFKINREATAQYLAQPQALEDAWKSAQESTAENIEKTKKALDDFNSAMIRLNQRIKTEVDKQKGYAAAFVTPWITEFQQFLQNQPWAAPVAAMVQSFGGAAWEIAKELGSTYLIIRAINQLKAATVAASAEAGASAGAAYGTAFNAATSSELIKGIGKFRGILLGANLAAALYKQLAERPEEQAQTPENAVKKQSRIWSGLGFSDETAKELADPNWLQNTIKGWFGIKNNQTPQPAQTQPGTPQAGPNAPVSEETKQIGRERDSYQQGGIVRINAHEGEMVLPRNISEGLQRLYGESFTASFGSDEASRNIDELNDMTRDYSQRVQQWLSGSTGVVPYVRIQTTPGQEGKDAGGAGAGAGGPGGGGGAGAGAGGGGAAGGGAAGGAAGGGGGGGPSVVAGAGETNVPVEGAPAGGGGKGAAGGRQAGPGTQVAPAGAKGKYRPVYNLTEADLSDEVVNTIAGEATGSQESTDAVIHTMFNRLGTKGYGPSGNLKEVAGAPGQFAAYNKGRPSAERAAQIRARIKEIASGNVKDTTGGANEFRAASYSGPWAQKHPEGQVIGGNRFAYNPAAGKSPYAPYREGEGDAAGGGRMAGSVDPPNSPSRKFQGKYPQGSDARKAAESAVDDMARLQGQTNRSPQLREYMQNGGVNLNPATTAWCAAFVRAALINNGLPAPESNVATAGANFGTPVDNLSDVRKGDIAIAMNKHRPGEVGGHEVLTTGRTRVVNGQVQVETIGRNVGGKELGDGDFVTTRWRGDVILRRPYTDDPNMVGTAQPTNQEIQAASAQSGVPGFQLGGLIPNFLQGVLPAILHPGEMILPRGLSDGLQGLIGAFNGMANMRGGGFGQMPLPGLLQGVLGAFGGRGNMPGLAGFPGMGMMAGNMMGMFNRPLGGDFRNYSYDNSMTNSRTNNLNFTQVNNMNLGGFTGDSSGDLPRRLAAVHRRTGGDLVRNFQLAAR